MKFSLQKFVLMIIVACWVSSFYSCQKDEDPPPPGLNLSLDSIVATKTNIMVWEEIYITAFADFPVYKFTNGSQLTNLFAFQVGLRKSFPF